MSEMFLIIKDKGTPKSLGELSMKLAYEQPIDFSDYNVSIANDFKTLMYDRQQEIMDYIFEEGLSSFVGSRPLNEDVLSAGASRSDSVSTIRKYLAKLQMDNELIIVDPFFFAPTRLPDYPGFIEDIFSPFIPLIDTVRIITTDMPSKIDSGVKTAIEVKLRAIKPGINIYHTRSSAYHDRYIISHGRDKGMIVGTSFNGLGNKLALVDRLNTSDVREIVADLIANGLI